MSALTVKGTLPIGIEVDGKRYREFTTRPSTLRDSCLAADALDADVSFARFEELARNQVFDGLEREQITKVLVGMYERAREAGTGASPTEMHWATIVQCLEFDGLPREKLTIDVLMGMHSRDAVAINAARGELEKKLDALSSS